MQTAISQAGGVGSIASQTKAWVGATPRWWGEGGGGGEDGGLGALNMNLSRGFGPTHETLTLFKTQRCTFCCPV